MGNAHWPRHSKRPPIHFCDTLVFWFDIHWLPRTKAAIATAEIHINIMEFAIVILQLAAVIAITEEPTLQPNFQPASQLWQNC
jgi:hypothetical protein